MSTQGYPRQPIDQDERERHIREFKEKQRQRHQRILEWKRKMKAALAAGDMKAVAELGPMYE